MKKKLTPQQILDKQLNDEILSDSQDREKIKELISKGANINAINEYDETPLSSVLMDCNDPAFSSYLNPPTKSNDYVKFLLDLGADPSIPTSEGFNCLFDACLTWNVELFEMLLKSGANPNCVASDEYKSILMYVKTECWLQGGEENDFGGTQLAQMVRLLEKYGAKHVLDIFTENISEFLNISPYYSSGLFTLAGNIRIENVPNVSFSLVRELNSWLESCPIVFDNGPSLREPDDDHLLLLKKFNDKGILIARQLMKVIGNKIPVSFFSFVTENEKFKYHLEHKRIKI